MDIKEIIENKIDDMGLSRAKVCERMGMAPQNWSKKMRDAKWSSIVKACDAIGMRPAELFAPKEQTTGFVECPKCHAVWKIKVEEE